MTSAVGFSEATSFQADGGVVVGIVICDQCSAAIMLDPRDDYDRMERHADWHERMGHLKPPPGTVLVTHHGPPKIPEVPPG